jgi:hypothetical protein
MKERRKKEYESGNRRRKKEIIEYYIERHRDSKSALFTHSP